MNNDKKIIIDNLKNLIKLNLITTFEFKNYNYLPIIIKKIDNLYTDVLNFRLNLKKFTTEIKYLYESDFNNLYQLITIYIPEMKQSQNIAKEILSDGVIMYNITHLTDLILNDNKNVINIEERDNNFKKLIIKHIFKYLNDPQIYNNIEYNNDTNTEIFKLLRFIDADDNSIFTINFNIHLDYDYINNNLELYNKHELTELKIIKIYDMEIPISNYLYDLIIMPNDMIYLIEDELILSKQFKLYKYGNMVIVTLSLIPSFNLLKKIFYIMYLDHLIRKV